MRQARVIGSRSKMQASVASNTSIARNVITNGSTAFHAPKGREASRNKSTIGVMATIGYVFLGLPSPAVLGVLAGLFEIIPMIGPFLAFAPAVLVALATVDPTRALMVVGYALVIQQIESNVLVPRVMGRTVGVSPLTVMLGILLGGALAGLPGAFLAVPAAGALQVVLAHVLRSEDASQSEEHRDPSDRAAHQNPAAARRAA